MRYSEEDSCVLKQDAHAILQTLGYRNNSQRQSILNSMLVAKKISQHCFPSVELLRAVEAWKRR